MPQALPRPPDLPLPQQRRSNRGTPARHDLTDIGDSTVDSSTCAAPPSASATSPTTSPAACSRPAASDPNYTLDCDEPSSCPVAHTCPRGPVIHSLGRRIATWELIVTSLEERVDGALAGRSRHGWAMTVICLLY